MSLVMIQPYICKACLQREVQTAMQREAKSTKYVLTFKTFNYHYREFLILIIP